jgi:DNA polymerase III subunit delta'
MFFSDIPGQHEIKAQLIQAFRNNRMAHAQLFAGMEGGAALALASALVSYSFCENPSETDSCQTCRNCQRTQKGIHPDIHHFFPKPSYSKDSEYEKALPGELSQFRKFIIEQPFGTYDDWVVFAAFDKKQIQIPRQESQRIVRNVSMKPMEGSHKIIFIWLPETMNAASANAILKVVEEPPANTYYFLVTNAYESVLPTITSRSLLIAVPPFTDADIVEFLSGRGVTQAEAHKIAKLSDGSLGLALQLMDDSEKMAYKEFREWMNKCRTRDFPWLVQQSEIFSNHERVAQRATLQFALSTLREVLWPHEDQLANRAPEEASFIRKFHEFLTFEQINAMYELTNNAIGHIDRNANPKLTYLNLSLEFSQLISK